MYIFWSFLGALLLAMASIIRGVESTKPLPAKFTLSLAYLVLSLATLLSYRSRKGPNFVYPWMEKQNTDDPTYRFSKRMLAAIIAGGLCEFVGSVAVIMSFNAALAANIN